LLVVRLQGTVPRSRDRFFGRRFQIATP
jgi:hypothetical protein